MEVVDYPGQDVVSLPYRATFEDDLCLDVEHLPKIQNIAQQVNAVSIGSLLYTTAGHFDSDAPLTTGYTTLRSPSPWRTGGCPATITTASLHSGGCLPCTLGTPRTPGCAPPTCG